MKVDGEFRYHTATLAYGERPSALTVGGGHDLSLLPRRLHLSSDSEQLSNLQAAAALLSLSQLLQLSEWVKAFLNPSTVIPPCWK